MVKHSKLALASALLLMSTYAGAAEQKCSGVKDNKMRLRCYDQQKPTTNTVAKQSEEAANNQEKIPMAVALKALRRINGARDIGVGRSDFNQIVLEQIFVVDEALRSIPMGETRDAIYAARKAYVDARTLWNYLPEAKYVWIFIQNTKPFYSKYDLDKTYVNQANQNPGSETADLDALRIVDPILRTPYASLMKAEELLGNALP